MLDRITTEARSQTEAWVTEPVRSYIVKPSTILALASEGEIGSLTHELISTYQSWQESCIANRDAHLLNLKSLRSGTKNGVTPEQLHQLQLITEQAWNNVITELPVPIILPLAQVDVNTLSWSNQEFNIRQEKLRELENNGRSAISSLEEYALNLESAADGLIDKQSIRDQVREAREKMRNLANAPRHQRIINLDQFIESDQHLEFILEHLARKIKDYEYQVQEHQVPLNPFNSGALQKEINEGPWDSNVEFIFYAPNALHLAELIKEEMAAGNLQRDEVYENFPHYLATMQRELAAHILESYISEFVTPIIESHLQKLVGEDPDIKTDLPSHEIILKELTRVIKDAGCVIGVVPPNLQTLDEVVKPLLKPDDQTNHKPRRFPFNFFR
ncbi:hypothetical protein A3F62_02935 [Candidatus Woesebacteria bacterium RIFCSPHIGHO2_12_FULL_44_11]|uniref:Uncharacterized protein n=1 Tax=Candidatus Woesebacteria bacterium RIFCSPLOWO2_01_FULL_44_14 TaxID=1802525 RepID=A0A1F8BXH8_9BACT|nr:MAG: hypothetical protein A3F62_02935 [Candidatus Woesebacteria bacterium RIFCSPHIGHO2_12_FULL_44_11]OGM68600.1 MAG: hypothetical protein A2975_00735 [Candidatus Woesebacteria bacterium RIFCSPLOWO2_01_FULL_44_14]